MQRKKSNGTNRKQIERLKHHCINNYVNCQWTKGTNTKPRSVKTGDKSKTNLSCLQDTHLNYKVTAYK